MPTVLELLNLTADYLGKKGVESPRLNAELLLSHVLNCKRLNLYLSFDRPLGEKEVNDYRELIRRRKDREPLQYIIGETEFYGMTFKVDGSVLIPRPETELLVETIINDFKDIIGSVKILDIGTGSGNIAIGIAKNLPQAKVFGVDISEDALKTAEINKELNNVQNVFFSKTDILNGSPEEKDFDIIVSNPPYIAESEVAELEPELKNYEPIISLTDKGDGTSFYKAICEKSSLLLKKNGSLYFELGHGQHDRVQSLMEANGFSDIRIIKDYQEIERIICGIKK